MTITTPKVTVRFDGVEDDWTATAIETQLVSGEITLDNLLDDIDGTCRALLCEAVRVAAEEGRPWPTWCSITVGDAEGSFGVDGRLIDSETGDDMRNALPAEIVRSLATDEGHTLVDGRKAYVS
jgi:hypothetical protein